MFLIRRLRSTAYFSVFSPLGRAQFFFLLSVSLQMGSFNPGRGSISCLSGIRGRVPGLKRNFMHFPNIFAYIWHLAYTFVYCISRFSISQSLYSLHKSSRMNTGNMYRRQYHRAGQAGLRNLALTAGIKRQSYWDKFQNFWKICPSSYTVKIYVRPALFSNWSSCQVTCQSSTKLIAEKKHQNCLFSCCSCKMAV